MLKWSLPENLGGSSPIKDYQVFCSSKQIDGSVAKFLFFQGTERECDWNPYLTSSKSAKLYEMLTEHAILDEHHNFTISLCVTSVNQDGYQGETSDFLQIVIPVIHLLSLQWDRTTMGNKLRISLDGLCCERIGQYDYTLSETSIFGNISLVPSDGIQQWRIQMKPSAQPSDYNFQYIGISAKYLQAEANPLSRIWGWGRGWKWAQGRNFHFNVNECECECEYVWF